MPVLSSYNRDWGPQSLKYLHLALGRKSEPVPALNLRKHKTVPFFSVDRLLPFWSWFSTDLLSTGTRLFIRQRKVVEV